MQGASWTERTSGSEEQNMATFVRYVPENCELDLANLSLRDYQLITRLHGEIRRGEPVLICLRPGGRNGEMFIRERDGRFFAAHFKGGAHEGGHEVVLESPAHRRQKEYWARGAEAAGLRAAVEWPVRGGRLDVAITGGDVDTDVEIQRSEITQALARRRTTLYFRAGFLPVWFNDGGERPLWLREVPALGCVRVPWNEQLPRPRAVTATGLTSIEAVRCEVGAFERGCPDGRRRPCGRLHPRRAPWRGLSVDDVAAMIPAGEILPMRGQNGLVYLVSPASMTRHQELTGGAGPWAPSTPAKAPRPAGHQSSAVCINPVHRPASVTLLDDSGQDQPISAVPPRMCNSCGVAPAGPGGILCGPCRTRIEAHRPY
jgi:hypothetical protein